MRILGIGELDNDAGAALFVDSALVGAVNEERFSRRKRHAGFPWRSVAWLLQKAELEVRDLDAVVVVKPPAAEERRALLAPLEAYGWWSQGVPLGRSLLNWMAFYGYKLPHHRMENRRYHRQLDDWLRSSGVSAERVTRVDHHRAHAASAFYASGFPHALVVTMDGQGAGVTATAWRGDGARLERLHRVTLPHSMGFVYALVTRALGFRPSHHEGKVTGLAAYAEPGAGTLDLLREVARPEGAGFVTPGLYGIYPRLKLLLRQEGPGAVASAAQTVLEEVVTHYVSRHLEATGSSRVALAGGVFGNVKLNQRVAEMQGVEEIFVFPHMGDGGLGYGGIVDLLAAESGRKPVAIPHVLWGPAFDDAACERALRAAGLGFTRPPDMARETAELLARGRTVGRFAGRMEFGPRALGNRSILHQATDPTVNDWLNRALRRTEFMPFAPVTLAGRSQGLYAGLERARHAAEFMTVTFHCSDGLRQQAPAVVHVDGTARPQLLRADVSPDYAAILEAYERLTGLPALINTSFNLHEEPIVLTPDDAVRAARAAGLDALILGPYLAGKEGSRR